MSAINVQGLFAAAHDATFPAHACTTSSDTRRSLQLVQHALHGRQGFLTQSCPNIVNTLALARSTRCCAALAAADTADSISSVGGMVVIPIDWYTVLRVAPDAQQQALQSAHAQLCRQQPVKLGISRTTLQSRDAVLRQAAEEVVDPETRAIYDQLQEPLNFIEVRQADVPGALCLLYEAGAVQALSDAGLTYLRQQQRHEGHLSYNADSVKDVTVLTASALWSIAAALLNKNERQDILDAYDALTDGLQLLQQHPPNDKQLLTTFQGALQELAPSVALQLVGLPLDAKHTEQRTRGLALLKEFLSDSPETTMPAPGALAAYLQSVRRNLTADEEAQVLSVVKVEPTTDVSELFELALYHVAQGCRQSRAQEIEKAAQLLRQCMTNAPAMAANNSNLALDVQVGLSTCLQLLGSDDEALHVLNINSPNAAPHPSIQQYFIDCAEEGKDSVSTLRLLANRWLEDIAFQTCRDSAPWEPFTVERWLKEGGVQVQLQGRNLVAGVLGAISNVSGDGAAGEHGGGKTPAAPRTGTKDLGRLVTLAFAAVAALLGGVAVFRQPTMRALTPALTPNSSVVSKEANKQSLPARLSESDGRQQKAVCSSTKMTEKQAQRLISRWLTVRAEALGSKPNPEPLQDILTDTMLDCWQQRVAEVKARNWHWTYSIREVRVDSVRDLPDGSVAVVTSIDELASVVDAGRVEEAYNYKYKAEYTLRKEGKKWKIALGFILTI